MKKNGKILLVAAALLGALCRPAAAEVIEGYTPSGKFRSVGVTEDGRFKVDTSTGLAQHVIVDSGTISVQNVTGGELTVRQGSAGSTAWPVSTSVGVTLTVQASTAAVPVTAAFSVSAGPAVSIYPADPLRKQGIICTDAGMPNLYIGGSGIGTNAAYISGGGCLSPDVPSRMTGELFGRSTATVTGFYLYWQ